MLTLFIESVSYDRFHLLKVKKDMKEEDDEKKKKEKKSTRRRRQDNMRSTI